MDLKDDFVPQEEGFWTLQKSEMLTDLFYFVEEVP